MTSDLQTGPLIVAGYTYRLRLKSAADSVTFPEGATYAAQVRRSRTDATPIATLTSENGGIVRVDDETIEIVLAGTATAEEKPGKVAIDIVRTDVDPPAYLNILLEIPVVLPVTRGV